jgi:hypothetical protein
VIGAPILYCEIAHIRDRQAMADHLRAATYALARPEWVRLKRSKPPLLRLRARAA